MPWKTEKEEKIIQSLTCFSLEVSPPQETCQGHVTGTTGKTPHWEKRFLGNFT